MKLENKLLAAGLVAEIREYVRREVAGLAAAVRVAEVIERVEQLERRIAALEIKAKAARVVRLAR